MAFPTLRRVLTACTLPPCRADYLDRGLTPHLLDISKQGLRAKSMKPIFPVRSFHLFHEFMPLISVLQCTDPDLPVRPH